VNYKTFSFELIRLYYIVREVSLFWPTLYSYMWQRSLAWNTINALWLGECGDIDVVRSSDGNRSPLNSGRSLYDSRRRRLERGRDSVVCHTTAGDILRWIRCPGRDVEYDNSVYMSSRLTATADPKQSYDVQTLWTFQ